MQVIHAKPNLSSKLSQVSEPNEREKGKQCVPIFPNQTYQQL